MADPPEQLLVGLVAVFRNSRVRHALIGGQAKSTRHAETTIVTPAATPKPAAAKPAVVRPPLPVKTPELATAAKCGDDAFFS